MVGGVFEGRFMDKSEITAIATIPATPVLRGMFVNVINSPIQGLVLALNAIAEKKSA
jgi:ribosomal protein L10